MAPVIVVTWIVFAIGVCLIGRTRELGGVFAFLISLVFSPVAGIIVCAFSPSLRDVEYKENMLRKQRLQADYLDEIITLLKSNNPTTNSLDNRE